ncbi:uncharacterized protein LOC121592896 [Anopheles merus]|uniref:uncharacterized protein LOC121592896 n=1 Tax=Anopheles merus TaxID=30066 RepID=UPI001BE3FD3B|nr:uncharacterized protein LOC121592896 [Anopheles merus]
MRVRNQGEQIFRCVDERSHSSLLLLGVSLVMQAYRHTGTRLRGSTPSAPNGFLYADDNTNSTLGVAHHHLKMSSEISCLVGEARLFLIYYPKQSCCPGTARFLLQVTIGPSSGVLKSAAPVPQIAFQFPTSCHLLPPSPATQYLGVVTVHHEPSSFGYNLTEKALTPAQRTE